MVFIVFGQEVQSHNGQPCPHHHPNTGNRNVGTPVKKQFTSFIHLFDNHFCTQYVSLIKKKKTDVTGENKDNKWNNQRKIHLTTTNSNSLVVSSWTPKKKSPLTIC